MRERKTLWVPQLLRHRCHPGLQSLSVVDSLMVISFRISAQQNGKRGMTRSTSIFHLYHSWGSAAVDRLVGDEWWRLCVGGRGGGWGAGQMEAIKKKKCKDIGGLWGKRNREWKIWGEVFVPTYWLWASCWTIVAPFSWPKRQDFNQSINQQLTNQSFNQSTNQSTHRCTSFLTKTTRFQDFKICKVLKSHPLSFQGAFHNQKRNQQKIVEFDIFANSSSKIQIQNIFSCF